MTKKDISQKIKMHEYRVGLYLDACRKKRPAVLSQTIALCYEADRKIKSTALDSYIVLDRLIAEAATLRDGNDTGREYGCVKK